MYRLLIDPPARKDMDRLKGNLWQRVRDAILGLSEVPRPAGCVKLQGNYDAYRLRVGDYRIVYEIDDASQVVIVHHVKHRSDIYRQLRG